MKGQRRGHLIVRHYSKISLQKRLKLLLLVDQKGYSIAKAGRKLRIKPSTAKLIVKKYKENGTYFVSKAQKRQMEENCLPIQQERIQAPAPRINLITGDFSSKGSPQATENPQRLLVPQYHVYDGLERQYFLSNFSYFLEPEFMLGYSFSATYPMVMLNNEWR